MQVRRATITTIAPRQAALPPPQTTYLPAPLESKEEDEARRRAVRGDEPHEEVTYRREVVIYQHYVETPDGEHIPVLPPGTQRLRTTRAAPVYDEPRPRQRRREYYDDRPRRKPFYVFVLELVAIFLATYAALSVVQIWYDIPKPTTVLSGVLNSIKPQPQGITPATLSPIGTLNGPPSITAAQIDEILASYDSPAQGSGQTWYELGVEHNIDPAYAVAFFVHESTAGTAQGWAGQKGGGATTHNVGNIICAGYGTCFGRFRDYPDWQTGIADWYRLIDEEYIKGRGTLTVEQIIPVYAPSNENNVPAYIEAVNGLVTEWRTKYTQPAAAPLVIDVAAQADGEYTKVVGIITNTTADVITATVKLRDDKGNIYTKGDGTAPLSPGGTPMGLIVPVKIGTPLTLAITLTNGVRIETSVR